MRCVQLHKVINEVQVERVLEEKLGVGLELHQTKEGHVDEVLFGALQHKAVTLRRGEARGVVAVHLRQVSQHAGLSVEGKVVLAVHEFLQCHALHKHMR